MDKPYQQPNTKTGGRPLLISRLKNSLIGYFVRDPFEDVLLEMVRIRILPYRTLRDLLGNRRSKSRLVWCWAIVFQQLLTMIRLMWMIVLIDSWNTYRFIIGHFYGKANAKVFTTVMTMLATCCYLERECA